MASPDSGTPKVDWRVIILMQLITAHADDLGATSSRHHNKSADITYDV